MIKWLARLFIVWVAIIFVSSATEEILYGGQQLVEASNEAASATTTGHVAFPPVEREDHTAENELNTGKKARIQTDESDDDLLKIGLGTRGAYASYPSSFDQSSMFGDISLLTKKPIHLVHNHKTFKFKSNDHRLFPSGVSLGQVNSQASRSTTTRDFLSDFDKTHETDASASTKQYIPSATSPPESLSESFNLGRKTQLKIDACIITQEPLGNSVTHNQDGGRGTKRKMCSSESWGHMLCLKTGVNFDENDVQHSYATRDFLSGFPAEQPNRFSAEENCITMPQFNRPKKIQQVVRLFQLESNTPSYQNAGASAAPMMSEGGRIPQEMISMTGQNRENDSLSLKPPEQGEDGKSWGANQGIKSFSRSQNKHSLRAEQKKIVDGPKSIEPLLKQSPRPQHNFFESGYQGSSSEYPQHIPQVSKIPKLFQPETITTVDNHPSQIDCRTNYGRLKFNTDLFKGKGPYQLERSYAVILLNPIPRPSQENFLLTDDQLAMACEYLRSRHSLMSKPSMTQIEILMFNINRWYQYWKTHAKIDLKSFGHGDDLLKYRFVLPLYLLYVEMIISIIPFKKELQLGAELDYPQEMRKAIESYVKFFTLTKTPPDNGESKFWMEKQRYLNGALSQVKQKPSGVLWPFIEFWMESHYTDVWNHVRKTDGVHASDNVKAFLNTIFTYGIQTLNEKIRFSIPHE